MVNYTTDELMVCLLAREIKNNDLIIIGTATPLALVAYMLAKRTHAKNCILLSFYGGYLDTDFFEVSLNNYEEDSFKNSIGYWSSTEMYNSIILNGKVDIEFIRAAQIDMFGNINTSVIGNYYKPKVKLPGSAGHYDFCSTYKKVIVYMPKHNKNTFVKKVDFIAGAGFLDGYESRERLGIKGGGPYKVISNLGVFGFDSYSKRMKILSLHPYVELQEVIDNTDFELLFNRVEKTIPPTEEELRLIREEIDKLGIRKLEFLSSRDRLKIIKDLIKVNQNKMA